MTEQTYSAAGVNLDAAQDIKERIGAIVKPTHGPQVLGGVGGFGAIFSGALSLPMIATSSS